MRLSRSFALPEIARLETGKSPDFRTNQLLTSPQTFLEARTKLFKDGEFLICERIVESFGRTS